VINRNRVLRSMLAALVLSLMVTQTALAAQRTVSVLNVWGFIGPFGTHTNFFGIWQVREWHGEGEHSWLIEKFHLNALVINGKACDPNFCADWSFGASAKFLNAAGQQLASLVPAPGGCYDAAHSPRDRYFARCGWVFGHEIPRAVTKVKITWTVSVQRHDGFWFNAWGATKTFSLR
jgi:hypothetical protein